MGRKTKEINEAASVAPQVSSGKQEHSGTRYVVVRDGHRVSANEYANPNDPKALDELKFWRLVENKHSWGAPVKIVEFDNQLHRIWQFSTK